MSKKNRLSSTKENPLKNYKKKLGDRKDGRRIRTLEPMTAMIPFFMKTRNDATNLISDSVEMSAIEKFVREKKAEGKVNFNAMHVMVASYVRAISQKPGLNRFVSGYRIYARNSIEVIMEVKKKLELNAPATMLKFYFNPFDTVDDVYEEMNSKITAYQNEEEKVHNNMDKALVLFSLIPRGIFKFIEAFLEWLDYHGWLPRFLLDLSPMHGSLVITSMASLGIPSIYHHLYNFGNCPMFISFSAMRHANVVDRSGEIKKEHYLDLNFSVDDRICDGQYYASGLHEMRKYLKNPQLLCKAPETVIVDIR